jgi:hypothetical protein
MLEIPLFKRTLPLWQRLAVVLGFLALASALLAPSALLAEEMRNGKLGGLCRATSAFSVPDTGNALAQNTPCDACSSLAFALPSFAPPHGFGKRLQFEAIACTGFDRPAIVAGLPPNRGPPTFLN